MGHMNYIVFDLEWNQCPDGKDREKHELPFEILEIGAVKLNSDKEEIDRFHEYIRPVVYPRLHYKTKEIIHINHQLLQNADTFPAVISRFQKWCGEDAHYCTWGALDLLELQRNMRYYKTENFLPFPLAFYDIQKIFSLSFEDGKSRRTLEYAVDMLRIEKDVPFHEALSDAYYTAMVIRQIPGDTLQAFFSIDYFRIPQNRSEEVFVQFPTYTKFVSRRFSLKSEIMRDRGIISCKCYLCGKKAVRQIPWFAVGTKSYVSLFYCAEHGFLKSKIRIKKTENGKGYFCVKTIKQISDERADALTRHYEELLEKRKKPPKNAQKNPGRAE